MTRPVYSCFQFLAKEENQIKKFYFHLLFVLLVALPAFGQAAPQTAEDFHKLGNQQLGENKVDDAIKSYSESLKLSPNNVDALYKRAIAYTIKAANEPHTNKELIEADGVNIMNETRLKGLADANKVIELAPRNPEGYYIRAELYAHERIFDKAIADYRKTLTVNPDVATTHDFIYKRTTAQLAKAEKELPFSIVVKGRKLDLRAMKLIKSGDKAGARKLYEQAVQYFTDSIALDKTKTDAFNDRARIYRNLEKYDAAIADYTEVIKMSEAKKLTDKAYISIGLYALIDRAGVYALQNKTALVLADYEAVLATPVSAESEFPIGEARYYRAKLYLDIGKTDDAIAEFDKILAKTPKYARVLYLRGLAYSKKGDKAKAIADTQKALELDPKNQDAKEQLKKLTS